MRRELRGIRRAAIGLILFWGATLGAVAIGAEERLAIESVRVGFAGKFKIGFWTPVQVKLNSAAWPAESVQVDIEAPDSDGVPVTYAGRVRSEAPGGSGPRTLIEYVKFGRLRSGLKVRLRVGDRVLEERRIDDDLPPALTAGQPLLVTLRAAIGIDDAARQVFTAGDPPAGAVVDDPLDLPDRWWGYESVHMLAMPTSDFAWYEQLDEPRREALDQWLRWGGRLLLSVGKQGSSIASTEPWSTWLPGQFEEVGSLRRTSGIESFAAAEQRLAAPDGGTRIDFLSLRDVVGRVDASETLPNQTERPIVVRYGLSLGYVTLVAFDLDIPPVSDWAGRVRLVTKILQNERVVQTDVQTRESQGQVTHLGFDDLVGQLRTALDQFPGVRPIAFGWIVTLLIVYAAVIGPADYFFHRKWGRPEATWLTFPLTALTLCGLAVWLGATTKDSRTRLNQVDVIDADATSGLARGTSWLNVYSPASGVADWRVELTGDLAASAPPKSSSLLSWQGVPGRGVGGLGNSATSLLSIGEYRVDLPGTGAKDGELRGLPMAVASTRLLSARWFGQLNLETTKTKLRSEALDGQLRGRVANPWPFPLVDWTLVHGNWMYREEGALQPGDEIELGEFSNARYLDWHLTRRRVSSEHKDVTTPWDERSTDVARIVEMMMFHKSAGGQTYTKIANRYQGYLDLTDHLRLGRAVLIGKGPLALQPERNGAAVVDSHDQQITWYRLVIPVDIGRGGASGK